MMREISSNLGVTLTPGRHEDAAAHVLFQNKVWFIHGGHRFPAMTSMMRAISSNLGVTPTQSSRAVVVVFMNSRQQVVRKLISRAFPPEEVFRLAPICEAPSGAGNRNAFITILIEAIPSSGRREEVRKCTAPGNQLSKKPQFQRLRQLDYCADPSPIHREGLDALFH